MVDLDALERLASGDPRLFEDYVEPGEVLALVRVVRAAQVYRVVSHPSNVKVAAEELDAALAPFREGSA